MHAKIVVVCATKGGKVNEYWWGVTPGAVRLKSPGKGFSKGVIYWQLQAYDQSNGKLLDFKIDRIVMGDSWQGDLWGQPERVADDQWKLDVNIPSVHVREAFEYTIYSTIHNTDIVIDPEVDFDP